MSAAKVMSRFNVFFIIGKPGSGKGTQCLNLLKDFHPSFQHLSAGELLRQAKDKGGEEGTLIANYMKEGKIVPVEITIGLLKKAMNEELDKADNSERYFLIDGFPRNMDNVNGWNNVVGQDGVRRVIYFTVSDQVAIDRCLGREGGRLDDNLDSLKKRLRGFENETQIVIDQYDSLEMISRVNGEKSQDEVYQEFKSVIQQFK